MFFKDAQNTLKTDCFGSPFTFHMSNGNETATTFNEIKSGTFVKLFLCVEHD